MGRAKQVIADELERCCVLKDLADGTAFKKLMEMSNIDTQKDMSKSDVEDVFLDWDGEIRMVVEGDVVKDVHTNVEGGD